MNASAPHRPRLQRFATQLLGDDRGSTAIEFAMVGFFSFIFIIGTIELAVEMIVDATVQVAAQEASRVGLTTTAPATGTRVDEAQAVVNRILGGWTALGATLKVTELDYGTYSNLNNPNYQAAQGMGGYSDVVAYNIQLTMPGITGIPKLFGVSSLTFQRNYIVQNEK